MRPITLPRSGEQERARRGGTDPAAEQHGEAHGRWSRAYRPLHRQVGQGLCLKGLANNAAGEDRTGELDTGGDPGNQHNRPGTQLKKYKI